MSLQLPKIRDRPKNGKTVLIDGDIVVYKVACVSEDDPLPMALHSVKMMIEDICTKAGAEHHKIYLTGPGNFRYDIATIREYKSGRKEEKPKWFYDIREYLVKYQGAEVCEGYEADDALAIEHTKAYSETPDYHPEAERDQQTTILASTDKDLKQVKGWNYNWDKNELRWITEGEGIYFFFTQILTGDQVDSIVGCPGIGPKKAQKILFGLSEEEMFWACLCEYEKKYGKGNEWGITPLDALIENARLLWMVRERDANGELVMWEVPV